MKNGLELIADERKRQIEKEGWSKEHDALHTNEELVSAAKCYETPEEERIYQTVSFFGGEDKFVPIDWPWESEWWKPSPEDRIRELVKAAALYRADEDLSELPKWTEKIYDIASEIDQLINNNIEVYQAEDPLNPEPVKRIRAKNRIEIKDAWDLECIMCDMFHEFLESICEMEGMTREPDRNVDGSFADEVGWIYTQKAMKLIDRYKSRMNILFIKHFPDYALSLQSSFYIEP